MSGVELRSGKLVLTAVAVVTNALSMMPVFLLGALSGPVLREFGIEIGLLGFTTALLFFVAGVVVVPCSLIVQRLRDRFGVLVALTLTCIGMLTIAGAGSFTVVLVAMCIGGLAAGFAQPAANLRIAEQLGHARLGLGFGLKQASVPFATLLCGLMLAVAEDKMEWRQLFLLAALLPVLTLGIEAWNAVSEVRRRARRGASVAGGRATGLRARWGIVSTESVQFQRTAAVPWVERSTMLGWVAQLSVGLVVVGAALGAGAATALGVFLVPAGIEVGFAPSTAGMIFACASAFGLVTRIALGVILDRRNVNFPLRWVIVLLAVGTIGYVLVPTPAAAPFLVGTTFAFLGGWTWQGVFEYTFVRRNLGAAARVTGITQIGLMLGSGSGPLLFSAVVQSTSSGAAWMVLAAIAALAVACLVTADRIDVRSNRRS